MTNRFAPRSRQVLNPWRAALRRLRDARRSRPGGGFFLGGLIATALGGLAGAASVRAQTGPEPAIAASSAPSDPASTLDASVEQRVGSLLRNAVASGRNSAAVLEFVRNGKVRISEGFGFEDPEQRVAITTAGSRFKLISISKIFVALAVAKLKQSGQIGSYSDAANQYLSVYRLPDSNGEKITIDELATHTAGLDESLFGLGSATPDAGLATAADLARRQPRYFIAPGQLPVYSSFGIDVLGLLVADVTRMPYPVYVEQSILQPLGMTQTLMQYPGGAIAHEVRAFQPGVPSNTTWIQYRRPVAFPDGAVLSTGDDMARLMLALLDRGAANTTITADMQEDLFRMHHQVVPSGVGYGLIFEVSHAGSHAIAYHRGGGNGSQCVMALIPAQNAGLFECITTTPPVHGTAPERQPLNTGIVDNTVFDTLAFGDSAAVALPSRSANASWNPAWNQYLGEYLWTDRQHFGIGRLRFMLHPEQILVERGTSGLKIDGIDNLTEISPACFGAAGVAETFTFFDDPRFGRRMLSRSMNGTPFESPYPQNDPHLMTRVLAALIGIAATGFLWMFWPRGATRWTERIAPVLFGLCMFGGAVIVYGLHMFGLRYYVGDGLPVVLVRILGFLVIPIAFILTFMALKTRATAPGASGGTLARVHLFVLAAAAWLSIGALANAGVLSFVTN